ncbi:hypothetical protein EDD16DRAFT_1232737 [Pisolithus croceorrhizus]|nr:hypothetical protein EDD16DRAFT_1232737 [Pisolithus croceorrhizus]
MSDSHQDVYAKHMQHADYGYPLRMPEPMSTLPQSYQESGLQIGDVGIVDNKGQFDVLFNICKRSDNLLHDLRGVPKNFQPVDQHVDVKLNENAICAGPIHSRGIKRVLQPNKPRAADYEFDSFTPTGAVLILPHGAMSTELLSPEQFRKVATKNALDWYEFAKECYGDEYLDCSLYLITGFYKARSWSLGSFSNSTDDTGKIFARRDDNNPDIYILEFTISADSRHGRGHESGSINQTVFISGFKITVSSWLPDPVVLRVTESPTVWSIFVCLLKTCLSRLRSFSGIYKQPAAITVEHSPRLSQPFDPSDIINRFLLSKKPNAKFAVTHDDQWMDMMKEGLTHEDLLQEDRLETFLTRCYTISVGSEGENTAVFLQRKTDGTPDSVSSVVDPRDLSPELEMSDPPASELEVLSSPTSELEFSLPTTPELEVSSSPTPEFDFSPTPSLDRPCIVITRTHPFLCYSY